MKIIEQDALDSWIENSTLWRFEDDHIIFETVFDNFIEAFAFLTQVAILSEKHNHHPTIINSYGNVHISMNTHDAGNKITDRDLNLAEAIEELL